MNTRQILYILGLLIVIAFESSIDQSNSKLNLEVSSTKTSTCVFGALCSIRLARSSARGNT